MKVTSTSAALLLVLSLTAQAAEDLCTVRTVEIDEFGKVIRKSEEQVPCKDLEAEPAKEESAPFQVYLA